MAAYEEGLRSVSLDADSSVGVFTGPPGVPGSAAPNTGKQYCALKITGSHQVGLATASTDNLIGVLNNKPQAPGQPATVAIGGISIAMAGAAVSAGAEVIPQSVTGRWIPGTTTGKGRRFFAVEPAAGNGLLFPVMIIG